VIKQNSAVVGPRRRHPNFFLVCSLVGNELLISRGVLDAFWMGRGFLQEQMTPA